MSDIKLTYFDFSGGRGEDCRLALHIAGVDFDDDRVKGGTWKDRKAQTPFGSLPVLEVAGKGQLAQSNVILRLIGSRHGLHPTDEWEAARHESIMGAVEDLRAKLAPSLRMKDEDEKKRAREEVASDYIPKWAANIQDHIGEGPFVGGSDINVVDLKLYTVMNWFIRGGLDHVSPEVFAGFPKLSALYDAVKAHPRVVDWYETH